MKWTNEQAQAISAKGGTVLVSAAAGSGKTAVLVERVIQKICDTAHPCSIDRLLIVTFTKAAAAEMRERIAAALAKRLENDPQNRYLLRQQLLLPSAQICTMDSFCSSLVKTNYTLLDISPDFRMLDESERKALEEETVTESLLPFYTKTGEAFENLSELFLLGGSDRGLKDAVLDLYHYAQAYPFPKQWLSAIPPLYAPEHPVAETPWGQEILQHIAETAEENLQKLHTALELLENDAPLLASYQPALSADIHINEALQKLCKAKDWDGIKQELDHYKPERLKSAPKEYKDSLIKTTASALRDSQKKAMKGLLPLMPATEQEYKEDAAVLMPMLALLTEQVLHFSDLLEQKKRTLNTYDFNDIAHMALELCLTTEADGTIRRTKLAQSLCAQYEEILLDEYQDTNEAQDMLFSALSDAEKNLFMVGDVKQSIYAFRRAMPDIFVRRRENASLYDGTHFPARIDLNANFRSRAAVAQSINAVFSKIMSENMGGVRYDAAQALNPCGDFAGTDDLEVELHLLEDSSADEDGSLPEAVHIAKTIRKMVDSKMPILQKNHVSRAVSYGDICILMRSASNADKYKEALEQEGIPAFFQKKGGFFAMREIQFMVSLLRILDNPYLDVPLCACLLSPVWGFTPDDLAMLKTEYRAESFFARLSCCALPKAKKFLADYTFLRRLSTALTPIGLIRAALEKTGYMSIVSVLSGGENRKLNLLLFLQYAEDYEAKGQTGLSGFLRYLEKLQENESSVEAAAGVSSYADVVRIMTIHKSKGLEFPVVILAKCGSAFNTQDQKKKMLLHNAMKIGIKVPQRETHRLYSSVPYTAAKLALSNEERAEELRVLYVALTRAKEKLILVGSGNKRRSLQNIVRQAAIAVLNSDTVPKSFVRQAGSYMDLLLAALMKHPAAASLLKLADLPPFGRATDAFPLKIVLEQEEKQKKEHTAENKAALPADTELLAWIASRVQYRYDRECLSACPSKASASALNEKAHAFEFFAAAQPAFMGKSGLTPAMRGAAMHRFAEKCDFARAVQDLEGEITRLKEKGFFTEEETDSLQRESLKKFLQSDLCRRIQQADALYREQKFTVFFNAGDIQPELPEALAEEKVLIQGVLDCAFMENGKIILVDYKTDREKEADKLKEQYKKQLFVYKRAAQEIFVCEVSETMLYSFYLNKEIPLNL